MKPAVVILGAGGHAKVLVDALFLKKIKILGFTDPVKKELAVAGKKIKYLGRDEVFLKKHKKALLVNGIGSTGVPETRRKIFEKFKAAGFEFAGVIHPSAVVSSGARLKAGVQIMAGAVVQAGCVIGENTIINTKASVDHDCHIGAHVHVAPGATLCGNVQVGEESHIGSGTVVIQGIKIGKKCLIKAASLVKEDVLK